MGDPAAAQRKQARGSTVWIRRDLRHGRQQTARAELQRGPVANQAKSDYYGTVGAVFPASRSFQFMIALKPRKYVP